MTRLRISKPCIIFLFCSAAAIVSPAQNISLTTLVSLGAPLQPMHSEGAQPYAGLVQGADGNLYGTTFAGGDSKNCLGGCGTVFRITPAGVLTLLYSFCAESGCPDGTKPYAGLVQATDGNFYGTTYGGGAYGNCVGGLVGCGTVFKMTPVGGLTTLHSFDWSDGATPFGGLVQAQTDENFYGTTSNGGSGGTGTVFKITPSGTLTMLHSFDYIDGSIPLDALVQANDGNFYGTTHNGSGGGEYLLGNVFEMTPAGELTSLYGFCPQGGNCTDGENPGAALVQANDGNFYGTTNSGGAYDNCNYVGCGTVFKITPGGELTTLHSFNGTDGQPTYAALVQATDGNFYGTAAGGGYGYGTIFKMTPTGEVTTLYSFCRQGGGCIDGAKPTGGLVQARDGSFYGTTYYGGTYDGGTVFRLDVVPTCATCRQ